MTQISGVLENKQIQRINKISESEAPSSATDFDSILKTALTANSENKVSEEELFAGLIKERLTSLKGTEIASKYEKLLEKNKQAMQKPDGFIPVEDAARASLKQLQDKDLITDADYKKVYAEAFSAAQLDSNKGVLWDSRGGGSDITIAMQTLEAALASAKTMIAKFDSGEVDAQVQAASTSGVSPTVIKPTGNKFDGAGEFLFKPVSNNESKLAVLLPQKFAHMVESVVLKDLDGKEIDRGRSTGYGDTGAQEKFSFNKQGGEYPKNIQVEVRLHDGSTQTYEIPDPSQRYD